MRVQRVRENCVSADCGAGTAFTGTAGTGTAASGTAAAGTAIQSVGNRSPIDRSPRHRRSRTRSSRSAVRPYRGSFLPQRWCSAFIACAVTLVLVAQVLPAQQAVADSLWRTGKRSEALIEYRRIVAADSHAVRANYRIAEDLAGRNVDSALVFLRNARVRVPDDPDFIIAEATYLSWARRFDAAVLRFDSAIAAHPGFDHVRVLRARTLSWKGDFAAAAQGYKQVLDRTGADAASRLDAEFGLAQVAAWQGSLADAAERYSAILTDNPAEVRSLLGLAYVRSWQARPIAARDLVQQVIVRDSGNADARLLLESLSQSSGPALEVNASWSRDSDRNSVAWQTATQRFLVRDGVNVWGTAGSQQARDPIRQTSRLLGEVGGTVVTGLLRATAAAGARQLDVSSAPSGESRHTEFTWRANAAARLRSNLALGLGVSHVPFDEIAALLARGINLTNYDGNVEWSPISATTLVLSGGVLDLSDGNRRTSAALRVARRFPGALTVGAVARTFSFAEDGDGYFSPERFLLGDLYASWEREISRWSLGLTAGGGLQKIGPDHATQNQWHADARVGLRVSSRSVISLSGGTSTSAAASAVGAFRYQTAGLSARIVF